MSDDLSDILHPLVEQAVEQIDRGEDDLTVTAALAFEHVDALDEVRSAWDFKYDLGPHLRAEILFKLRDCDLTELHEFLEKDDHARTLGFDPEKFVDGRDAPDWSTFYRASDDYLDRYGLGRLVTKLCQRIRGHARETGNLLGSQRLRVEDKEEVSERTEYRVKRRKAHKMADEFREEFYDEIDVNLPENAISEKEDVLDLFLHMALTDDFANNGAKTWKEEVDDESTAPCGDTLRDPLRDFDELEDNEVSQMFEGVSEHLWQMADRQGYLDGFVDVAIDSHAWLYYGDPDTPRVSKVDPDRGTDMAYQFLTLSVIGDEGEKFMVAVRQVASRQEKIHAVKQLASMASERLLIRDIFADRGFYGTLFAQALSETGENFTIRAQAGRKSQQLWEEAEDGVNVERVEMSRSYAPYESVEVTRFVVPAREGIDAEYVAFITNRDLTKRQARSIAASYKRRWGIETSFRVAGDFLPKTTSKDVALREFYYRMSVLLYNIWVMMNAIVAASIGHPEDASPPVTAKYFLIVLRNKHDQGGDDAVT